MVLKDVAQLVEFLLTMQSPRYDPLHCIKPGMVAHTFDPYPQKLEKG